MKYDVNDTVNNSLYFVGDDNIRTAPLCIEDF